jgi:hypothetical protein
MNEQELQPDGYIQITFTDGHEEKLAYTAFEHWEPHPAGVMIYSKEAIEVFPWTTVTKVYAKNNRQEYVDQKRKEYEQAEAAETSVPGTGQFL